MGCAHVAQQCGPVVLTSHKRDLHQGSKAHKGQAINRGILTEKSRRTRMTVGYPVRDQRTPSKQNRRPLVERDIQVSRPFERNH